MNYYRTVLAIISRRIRLAFHRRAHNVALRVALLVLGFVSVPSAFAQNSNTDEIDFVVGNFEFVLLHELAHLVIGEKDVPIIGPIEGAADYIAATILARGTENNPESTKTLRAFTRSAATAFATSWQMGNQGGAAIPYWDSHALGIQRYYSVLCLLYGSDPDGQRDIPLTFGLPEQRAIGCGAEFEAANRGLEWLLSTYGNTTNDASASVATFQYGEPRTRQQARAIEEIRRLNIFDRTVSAFAVRFALTEPFVASMRTCGQPEAAWQPEIRELVVCYELIDAFFFISRNATNKKLTTN